MFIEKYRNIWLITKCLLPLHQKKKLITSKPSTSRLSQYNAR